MELSQFFGAILVGSWLNNVLYVIEIVSAVAYFSRTRGEGTAPTNRWWIQGSIGVCVVVDTAALVATHAAVYLYCVSHWGDISYLAGQHWPVQMNAFTNAINVLVGQNLLIFRCWRATRMWSISILLWLLSLLTFAATLSTFALLVESGDPTTAGNFLTRIVLSLVSATVTDIGIAVCLVNIHSASDFNGTKSIIRRLILNALRTGIITSIGASIALISFLTDRDSGIPFVFGFCFGRIYTLTVLYNLRTQWQISVDDSSVVMSSTDQGAARTGTECSIDVHHEKIVSVDFRLTEPHRCSTEADGESLVSAQGISRFRYGPDGRQD
ncbi:unnamed protein product [Mycena citricolor]|uniref:DUF6534 domain-containing protein n=1 Tax=Mycena citricolor TaxID=2018698 RepID=A0AAD2HN31_9AGAR|nr:unnamed protein product [Mycena citricolor]CAK5277007.1 unnamed protein product [Mycena citricolor]